ncbi:exodeoxyribonuclease VII large subunit [Methylophilaceae bacterium]|uniref:Exodeoxyribonuclease 7 large subunit n=1 Tax=Methylophilales bacterium HTCC2181 TaxID=383631 RepID=A0P7M0_9PROT|nr:xseA; exodeoxyribonuclease vII large subunit protein [Methylophilales bacterium HTCC2181]MCH9782199.1 exodeoxyribonuclease VII large subunit [Betaproteobacteria bacterium]MDA9088044.1 exodeoxyribonuclease VII large subunit [Methylophilaceae bacterium]MCH9842070.1 exodeoxyribonuclease VII large subunit [Betaproteobacteria bacterium]MDB9716928.1 exodeoxyribonuclease VII large subunit [Methylophilaceae bacterium]
MNNSIKIQGDIEKNKIFSVSELNRLVKNILNTTFSLVWIKGEVSGFSSYSSGHWYFKLKDNTAQVDCVMFARKNQQLQWQPKNGDFLELQCQVSLYEANGKYQLIIETMQKAGLGELFEKYIDLKNKLEQAGLFNEATKKLLPRFPRVIGVITSSDGAALRDVLSTLLRRNRSVSIIIYPTLVQGAAATSGICNAITKANERNEVDALIICRGGGSIEDLWSFNTESVAYAIFNSILPVISAVGHETDFTIADFVADTRAPTPTAAAEIISEGSNQILSTIDVYLNSMTKMFERKIEQSQLKLNFLERRLISPIQRIAGQKDLLKSYEKRMLLNINAKLESYRNKITRTIIQLPPPKQLIQEKKEQIDTLRRRLEINTRSQITSYSSKILSIKKNLLMLNPKSILKRGYSIVQDVDEKILRDTKNISVDDNIVITFHNGYAKAMITEKNSKK